MSRQSQYGVTNATVDVCPNYFGRKDEVIMVNSHEVMLALGFTV